MCSHMRGSFLNLLGKQKLKAGEGARWIIESMEVQKVNDGQHSEFCSRRLHKC